MATIEAERPALATFAAPDRLSLAELDGGGPVLPASVDTRVDHLGFDIDPVWELDGRRWEGSGSRCVPTWAECHGTADRAPLKISPKTRQAPPPT